MTDAAPHEPAFPCSNEQFTHGNPQTGDAWSGMKLRDYFAAHALSGLLAARATVGDANTYDGDRVCEMAFACADRMLKARS